ncbi:hypothetical protein SNEBB_006068 [Seison nebaliae]|nr:hypothetical protein SNEBB_006068 [Seison nebaliae]
MSKNEYNIITQIFHSAIQYSCSVHRSNQIYKNICSFLKQLTLEEFQLDNLNNGKETSSQSYEKKKNNELFKSDMANVFYMELVQIEQLTVALFIIKPNANIPLHNHPDMHGIMKVMNGNCQLQIFTPQQILEDDLTLTLNELYEKDSMRTIGDICHLTPEKNNIHEILSTHSNDPLIFFDILTPSYSNERDCIYFETVNKRNFKDSISKSSNNHPTNTTTVEYNSVLADDEHMILRQLKNTPDNYRCGQFLTPQSMIVHLYKNLRKLESFHCGTCEEIRLNIVNYFKLRYRL